MRRDFGEDPRVTDDDINELYKRLDDGFREQTKVINKRCGKAEGEKRKMEMYGHQGAGGNSPLKKTKYGVGKKRRK